MIHSYKVWGVYFDKLLDGSKTFEVRKEDDAHHNSSNMGAGDTVVLSEHDQITREATGRVLHATVAFVLHGDDDVFPKGWVVFGIKEPVLQIPVPTVATEALLEQVTHAAAVALTGPSADEKVSIRDLAESIRKLVSAAAEPARWQISQIPRDAALGMYNRVVNNSNGDHMYALALIDTPCGGEKHSLTCGCVYKLVAITGNGPAAEANMMLLANLAIWAEDIAKALDHAFPRTSVMVSRMLEALLSTTARFAVAEKEQ